MLLFFARSMASRSPKFVSGSPPPSLAAMVISRAKRVKMAPRLASMAAFFRLIVDHLECPDIAHPFKPGGQARLSWRESEEMTVKSLYHPA